MNEKPGMFRTSREAVIVLTIWVAAAIITLAAVAVIIFAVFALVGVLLAPR